MAAIAPAAHAASTYLFQFDDNDGPPPTLTGNTYENGTLIQSVLVGANSFTGTYGLWSGVLLSDFEVRVNVYEADGVTLSDTWRLSGNSGESFLSLEFKSDNELAGPLANASSLTETGDWQQVFTFGVSNDDVYSWQFRSLEATQPPVIPEPGSLSLLGLALLGLYKFGRKGGAAAT